VLSGGRLAFGVGVGYLEPEFRALGIELKDHGPRSDEYLAVMRSIWSAEHPAYEGRFFRFSGVNAFPRPVQQPTPSLVIGGHSTAAYRREVDELTAGTASACRRIRRRPRLRRFAQLASAGCGRPSLVLSRSASLHHAATRIANSRDAARTWVSIACPSPQQLARVAAPPDRMERRRCRILLGPDAHSSPGARPARRRISYQRGSMQLAWPAAPPHPATDHTDPRSARATRRAARARNHPRSPLRCRRGLR
jgi:alkanesulfonate monooxygenase SsuD/methylene tetrahydromethanopterin reductase-like flavin-dependent oxidoreductase (luciferase family)